MRSSPLRRWRPVILGVLAAAGCSNFDHEGVLVGPPCDEQSVEQLQPNGGRADVAPDALAWADLGCPAPGATIALTGPDGEVPGTSSLHFGGRQIRFTPAQALDSGAAYSAHLETTAGFRDWEFSTAELGSPVGAPVAGRALALRAGLGALLSPPGLRSQLTAVVAAGLHPVLELREEPADGLVLVRLGARIADDPSSAQDLFRATWDARAAFADPRYGLGPLRLQWTLDAFPLLLEDAVLEGILGPDGTGGGGRLAGLWDTRPALDGLAADPCAAAEEAGQPCLPCRDGEPACLPFDLRDLPAIPWTGSLVSVDPP